MRPDAGRARHPNDGLPQGVHLVVATRANDLPHHGSALTDSSAGSTRTLSWTIRGYSRSARARRACRTSPREVLSRAVAEAMLVIVALIVSGGAR
jgi:hypothetical protein